MDRPTTDKETRHVWEFVQTLLGPAIYLGFFGLAYLASSVLCALSRGNSPTIPDAQAALDMSMIVITLVALALLAWHAANGARLVSGRSKDSESFFLGLVSLTLSLLSAVAVLWTALPAALHPPAC